MLLIRRRRAWLSEHTDLTEESAGREEEGMRSLPDNDCEISVKCSSSVGSDGWEEDKGHVICCVSSQWPCLPVVFVGKLGVFLKIEVGNVPRHEEKKVILVIK